MRAVPFIDNAKALKRARHHGLEIRRSAKHDRVRVPDQVAERLRIQERTISIKRGSGDAPLVMAKVIHYLDRAERFRAARR